MSPKRHKKTCACEVCKRLLAAQPQALFRDDSIETVFYLAQEVWVMVYKMEKPMEAKA